MIKHVRLSNLKKKIKTWHTQMKKEKKKTEIKRQTRHFATPHHPPTIPLPPPLRIRTTAQKINKMIDKKKKSNVNSIVN